MQYASYATLLQFQCDLFYFCLNKNLGKAKNLFFKIKMYFCANKIL